MLCGGKGNANQPDQESQDLLDQNQQQIQGFLGISYNNAYVISYQTQCVAGTNYFIHARTDAGQEFDVTIFEELPCNGGEKSVSHAALRN